MRPVFVGIAGGSASGKSTLAQALLARLGERCLLVLHDRYYHSLPASAHPHPLEHNFDHPDAFETARLLGDLARLAEGRPARLPIYDYATHRRAEAEEEVVPRPVVLVEGILVLADERLREVLHHRVFVSTPDDVRLLRRIRRDIDARGREVHDILVQYERTVRPMHERFVEPSRAWADLVLDGTRPVEDSVTAVLALIEPG
jgi:uridine kinase